MIVTSDIEIFKQNIAQKNVFIYVDYGRKKTGVAISTLVGTTPFCFPLCTIISHKLQKTLSKLIEIINNKNPDGIIIGFPRLIHNKNSVIEKDISFLSKEISKIRSPVLLYDESFSTKDAVEIMKYNNVSKNQISKINDQVAATIMLKEIVNQLY